MTDGLVVGDLDDARHWWNGQLKRLERRDLYLRRRGEEYVVEARSGGKDGVYRESDPLPEREALDLLAHYMGDGGEWRELSADR